MRKTIQPPIHILRNITAKSTVSQNISKSNNNNNNNTGDNTISINKEIIRFFFEVPIKDAIPHLNSDELNYLIIDNLIEISQHH